MPDEGTPQFTLTRADSEDGATAYLAAVNPLQSAIDRLTWHHGLLIGLAERDREDGGPGRVDPQLVIELREHARQLVLQAEHTAEAVWEITGEPGSQIENKISDPPAAGDYSNEWAPLPPRGPQMDAARAKLDAEPEPASHQDRRYDDGMGATEAGNALLEIRRAEVLDALRWIRGGMSQDVDGPSMFDLHEPAAIRASQLGWVRVMPAGTFELTRKGHAVLNEEDVRVAAARATMGTVAS